ncbi:GNAT family N-acetyltransferase [Haloactinospora alba]|uniref:GNAT family N-acetyltransferase n=1 Tax=Haloactinospora alba TaxID=405555 RepID=UPI001FEBD757|nr:GNAT family N-acetyltransferase [Haloactinospora alba]
MNSAAPATEAEPLLVRVMELTDLPTAVAMHKTQLPTGFFVELGERFLSRYYRTFLTSPAAVALVADVGGETAGYLVGCTDESAHRRHVLQLERWNLTMIGVSSLLARPALTAHFVRTRAQRYLRQLRHAGAAPSPDPAPTETSVRTGMLNHIAVDTQYRGAGIGATLVRSFVEIARTHGTGRLQLYTARDKEKTQRFYERLGWTGHEPLTDVDGRQWVPFSLELS